MAISHVAWAFANPTFLLELMAGIALFSLVLLGLCILGHLITAELRNQR